MASSMKDARHLINALQDLSKILKRDIELNLSGGVLNIRSGRLIGSLAVKMKAFQNLARIRIRTKAIDPQTGFDYASFHEFVSGRAYISPAVSKRANLILNMIRPAFAKDMNTHFDKEMVSMGWKKAGKVLVFDA